MNVKRVDQSSDTLIQWMLTCGFACLYIALRTSCHTFDSIEYVNLARNLPFAAQFHPHHLLYHQILFAVAGIERYLGWSGIGSIWIYILPSALFGGLCAGAVYRIGRRTGSKAAATIAAIGSGVSFSLVSMSTDVEKYPIALFFILTSLNFLIPGKDHETGLPERMVAAGASLAVATLMHQTTCLLLPLFMILCWSSSDVVRKRLVHLGWFAGTYGVLTGGVYFGVGWFLGFRTIPNLLNWMMRYAHSGSWGHGLSQPVRTWLEGHFAAMAGFRETWHSPAGLIDAHRFHRLAAFLYCAAWLWILLRLISVREPDRFRKRLRLVLLLWILIFTLFIVWWEPLNTKVAVLYVPAFWLLLGMSMTGLKDFCATRRAGRKLAVSLFLCLVVCLSVINIGRAWQQHPASANHDLAAAEVIAAMTHRDDLILLPYHLIVDRYLVYFFDRPQAVTLRSLVYKLPDPALLKSALDEAFRDICRTDKVFYFTWTASHPPGMDLSGHIRHKHIEDLLGDMTNHADNLGRMPNGDVLMRLKKDEYCTRYP